MPTPPEESTPLQRHFGLLHATAINVSMIVGAGVFITIPLMLLHLPGPYALLGWVVGGVLMLMDGLIWSELGAMLPGSGGSYRYLLEAYGRHRWGRLMAFLFIWQFLISGPLEVGSAFIGMAVFATALNPAVNELNQAWTWRAEIWPHSELFITISPMRLAAFAVGVLILVLLYRRVTLLGKLALTVWFGVLATIAWILIVGWSRFDPAVVFDFSGSAAQWPPTFAVGLGQTMLLAMYSYLGYYNICYLGDEVRDPGRTIPRAIILSAVLVMTLFIALHLAMLGTVSWRDIPSTQEGLDGYSLAAKFMELALGPWAVLLVTLLLLWSCFGSAFAALLGYSRIPYGAAVYGHFFGIFARVHPKHRIPHVSLLFVGGLTLFWTFFDLEKVIQGLLTTRIIEQFIGQVVGVMLLRKTQSDRPRPFRIWLYPLPCLLALGGWLYLYWAAGLFFIVLGLATLGLGTLVFFLTRGNN